MLDARSFGYLGGLGGKSNFDSVLSGGFLTPEIQEGYDAGSAIKSQLDDTDYSALSNYNYNVKRANYLGEEFEYNPDYDGLSTNLMYHKDYVADSDELKAAKNSLRAAGFADIPLFEPSSWAQAGVQFIKPNQFNAKTLPYSVSGAGVANAGVRESNVFGTLNNLWSEWGQYESSGFEGGNKMGGNKSIWEAMKTWNTGDRPESVNSIGSDYGSQAALATYLETGEITEDFNPTYALEAYDYGVRETARQQQTKTVGLFTSLIKGNIGAAIGGTLGFLAAGPWGAGVGAAAGATAQGIEAGNESWQILLSAAGSAMAASSFGTWINSLKGLDVATSQALGLTGNKVTEVVKGVSAEAYGAAAQLINAGGSLAGVNKIVLNGLLNNINFTNSLTTSQFANLATAAGSASTAAPALTLGGSQSAGLTGNEATALVKGVSAESYAYVSGLPFSDVPWSDVNSEVLKGLANNASYMNSLSAADASQLTAMANAAVVVNTGSKTVDAAITVLNALGKPFGLDATGVIGVGVSTGGAIQSTNKAKEYAKDAEVAAEEFGKDFGTVYEDAYSDDNASSQDSTLGALGPAMNPASRFTRRYGRTRFVAA
tara:strand:- start:275 stop:2077 length:1803 start_codon:yes stop_codon:yes gene_type:complete